MVAYNIETRCLLNLISQALLIQKISHFFSDMCPSNEKGIKYCDIGIDVITGDAITYIMRFAGYFTLGYKFFRNDINDPSVKYGVDFLLTSASVYSTIKFSDFSSYHICKASESDGEKPQSDTACKSIMPVTMGVLSPIILGTVGKLFFDIPIYLDGVDLDQVLV